MRGAVRVGAAGAILALALAGCKGGGGGNDPGRPPPSAAEKAVQHKTLKDVETRIEAAIAAGDLTGVAQGADEVLARGLADVRTDEPKTLKDEDRLRYSGLVTALEEKASALKSAAEANEGLKVKRAFQQTTASCVKCHDAFAQNPEGRP